MARTVPGSLVDFYAEGEIVCGLVLSEEKGRLRVVTGRGREERIAPGRVLASYEGDPRLALAPAASRGAARIDQAARLAADHARAAGERRKEIDLEIVWDLLADAGQEKRLDEIAELALGEGGRVAAAATLRALLEEKVHFVRKGDLWEPRGREAVAEILKQREREDRRQSERARFLASARDAIARSATLPPGGAPAAFVRSGQEEEARLIRLFEEIAVTGSAGGGSRDALAALAEIGARGETPEEQALRALVVLGVFQEDENLLIRRFGLAVDFPPGAESLAEAAIDEALGEGAGHGRGRSAGEATVEAGTGLTSEAAGKDAAEGDGGATRASARTGASPGERVPPRLAEEISRGIRRDLTGFEIASIDDEGTLEIDDALSVEEAGAGLYRVGIHIADPGFFVLAGSELDRIAESRAVTFYLPERRVLMLPRAIAERGAALVPSAPRPALSFFATLDEKGELHGSEIVPSVIRSRRRVTYEEADRAALQPAGPGAVPMPDLARVHGLALALETQRIAMGAHVIRAPEIDVVVGPDGKIELRRLEGDRPGRRLVSEMMILAGRIAARFCLDRGIPCIYRRQPPPEEPSPPVLGGDYDPVAVRKARRGLRRSETGTTPGRHYALGLDVYAQVTSPIRRYQDLAIHRQIVSFLRTGAPLYDGEAIQRISATTDDAERVARLAERGSDEYWTLRYLSAWRGREVEGVVVHRQGRRVEVELTDSLYTVSIPPRPDHELGQRLRLLVESVNPRGPSIRLRQID
jgi:hypothetical protein